MQQTPEAKSFLTRIVALPKGPGVSLDEVLQPSLSDEAELRQLFATDKTNKRLKDPFVGLVNVFDAPVDIRTTRARVVKDADDLSAKYVMPLSDINRRAEGTPSIVSDIEEFKKNWSIFTEGSLSQLIDWNNIVAAGGAVLACMTPLPDAAKVSRRSIRKFYHNTTYPTSDVDLFLWGLTAEQAEVKINMIFEAVRDSVPWDVTCVRTKHTVSIHSQYPYRSVQIVLRLYTSPAEILAGFDIDAPCCAYDGRRVWANPRAIIAMMRQCNTVDMTRRSPSYEVRLAKYSSRAFEVYVPSLRRGDIDPTIYERSITRIEGLARLLVLEKLTNTDIRYAFLDSRRALRGRPNPLNQYQRKKKLKGDLKADMAIGGLEMNDYDVASLHIPYGPGWDARRIDKLVYQTDLGMNSTFNPKNKGRRLHRHPAFFGTMSECLNDCCEHCPQPINEEEHKLYEEEEKHYIRGRISFMKENPGRQSITGSFHPIDVGEWSEQVYIGVNEQFFAAIASHDRGLVTKMIEDGIDVNRRDCVGRAPLHVAIISKAIEIACDLIDAGARITARIVDGQSSLHLAARLDQVMVVRKLLERSAINAEQGTKVASVPEISDEVESDGERLSSEDDWSSGDEDFNEINDEPSKKPVIAEEASAPGGDIPEDETDEPDVFDINFPDWDFGYSPLGHAALFASLPVIEVLLAAGADPKFLSKTKSNRNSSSLHHPLTLVILRDGDEDEASKIAERLLLAGASSAIADDQSRTIFHRAVIAGKLNLVSTFLRCDPNVNAVLNFPSSGYRQIAFPVVTAIYRKDYSMVALLLAHGAKLSITEEFVTKNLQNARSRHHFGRTRMEDTFMPVETSIEQYDDLVRLLIKVGADFNVGVQQAQSYYNSYANLRRSILDWVTFAIAEIGQRITVLQAVMYDDPIIAGASWKDQFAFRYACAQSHQAKEAKRKNRADLQTMTDIKKYLVEIEPLLKTNGAKTWNELFTDLEQQSTALPVRSILLPALAARPTVSPISYLLIGSNRRTFDPVPMHLNSLYDELYEACFSGSLERVEQLCLPPRGSTTDSPLLNISVQMVHPVNEYIHTGITPLYAAISGRQWVIAKLIMAIVEAQHVPGSQEAPYSTRNINLDSDSDSDDDSDASGDTAHVEKVINFIDIATRSSTIQSDVSPKKMLDETLATWWSASASEEVSGNHLTKAVKENDLEAFMNITHLYRISPRPIEFGSVYHDIIDCDRPEMLHEYIRWTGHGLNIEDSEEEHGETLSKRSDKTKMYLGLTVHGKKRMDLVRKNDPNASSYRSKADYPMLWKACLAGAEGVVDYLSGDRPLSAYRFYLASNSTEHAVKLRRIPDLETALPELLGWTINLFGESPLSAAILGKKFTVVKKLFTASPRLLSTSLRERIKFMGYNPLLLAVHRGCDKELIDYLLAQSVSPAETDQQRKWNVYHLACKYNHCDLIQYLLDKLPRDVSEALLAQQSKTRMNTPLHLAVKSGARRAVTLVINFTKSTLLHRDVDGSTPLHCAVKSGFPDITKILADVVPTEVLFFENGVGETALEIASLQEFAQRTSQFDERADFPNFLGAGAVELHSAGHDAKTLENKLAKLRNTTEALLIDGKLKKGTKLADELLAFGSFMESKLAEVIADEEARAVTEDEATGDQNNEETPNVTETLKVIRLAVSKHPENRHLVHLIDVQRSVHGALAKSNIPVAPTSYSRRNKEEEGLEAEENAEQQQRMRSMVFQHVDRWERDYDNDQDL